MFIMRYLHLTCALATCAALTIRPAAAQSDTTSSSGGLNAAWASVALGRSDARLAGTLGANVSARALILAYRNTQTTVLFSNDGLTENALLFGLRTGGRRTFVVAATGPAHGSFHRELTYGQCVECNVSGNTLAYELSLHANYLVAGLVASFSGSVGPPRLAHTALTAGVELGWFGR